MSNKLFKRIMCRCCQCNSIKESYLSLEKIQEMQRSTVDYQLIFICNECEEENGKVCRD